MILGIIIQGMGTPTLITQGFGPSEGLIGEPGHVMPFDELAADVEPDDYTGEEVE